jgi:hypothetical protein
MLDMKNTFTNGQVRVLVYQEKGTSAWYATALELNLTIDGDDRTVVQIELQQAIVDYIHSAQQIGDVSLLNQEPDPELLALWQANIAEQQSIASPYVAAFAGVERLVFA